MLLKPGTTCWRVVTAERAAILVDVEDYFSAVKSAAEQATSSILILGWDFHADTILDSEPSGPVEACGLAAFLSGLAARRPELDIRILCWKASLPVAVTQKFYPQRSAGAFRGTGVRFVLDGRLPFGASHHQKVVVVDDAVAFSGGCDFGPDRWDTCDHEDDNLRRAAPPGAEPCFDARHEVMSVVDGAAARSLGDLFRERWRRATGEDMPPPVEVSGDPWPIEVAPQFHRIRVGLSRSQAVWREHVQMREIERLHLASIAAAKRCIYLENQYFTSPMIAEALAQRLGEAKGPEVVLISTQHAPSYFDQMTMDRTRSLFIKRLVEADKHGRLRIYSPVTTLGHTIIVHAKLSIIDDVLVRIGSGNLNNRSLGFDTECDLSLEPSGPDRTSARHTIRDLRTRLIAHWLGCPEAMVEAATRSAGGVGAGIEHLRAQGLVRLRPIPVTPLKPLAALIAAFHIGDPVAARDAWCPWERRAAAKAALRRSAEDLRRDHLEAPRPRLSPNTN